MVTSVRRLREVADDFEQRGKNTIAKQAEMVDIAIRVRFLISEITKLFEVADEMEAA
jgi:hypothetical protein